MPCNKDGLLTQLKELVQQIDDGGCCDKSSPCCPPAVCCDRPFAQVCFTCPPCIPLPTVPCPVKPLQMPCVSGGPSACPEQIIAAEREAFNSRYDNFYNNYNIDYHAQALVHRDANPCGNSNPARACGVTVDGKNPHCEDYMVTRNGGANGCCNGCPTGFKPCSMKLSPPMCCNPIGVWGAQIMPCPPKPPKPEVSTVLPPPDQCKRPGCKHWKPEGGPCLYDDPCKAHCFNHPPGMKPSGRYP